MNPKPFSSLNHFTVPVAIAGPPVDGAATRRGCWATAASRAVLGWRPGGRWVIVGVKRAASRRAPDLRSPFSSMRLTPAARSRQNLRRLRAQGWPILETAGAALVAWYLAKLLLSEREKGFAPIAAVICLGATMGQQRERALELTGGGVLGGLIADLLVRVLGSGPPQVGLMMVLAMSAAVLVGGGPLLMIEASVSAIIIGSSAASSHGLFPTRPI